MSRRVIVIVLALSGLLPASPASGISAVPDVETEVPELVLVFPQDQAVTRFRSTFGDPRHNHRHQGNDLFAPKMTPVYAAADGVVTRIRTSGNAGRYLVITHAGGWETWYLHLNNDTPGTDDGAADERYTYAPGIEVGAFVRAGDLIAYVGDSGNTEDSSPHTHFELRYRGRAVDPYPYLAPAFERAALAARLAWLGTIPLD